MLRFSVYVNRKTREFWIVDYRIYDPVGMGASHLGKTNNSNPKPVQND